MKLFHIHYSLFIILCLAACHKQPVKVASVTTVAIPVDASADGIQDSSYTAYRAPTKAALEREMGVQIGYAPEKLWVGEPECPMLNWATDALWEAAKPVYPGKVDVAIVNMGGMRCPWEAGPVTKGNVFELMPFDNELVVLTLKGEDIIALCESFARYGGQGVAGIFSGNREKNFPRRLPSAVSRTYQAMNGPQDIPQARIPLSGYLP